MNKGTSEKIIEKLALTFPDAKPELVFNSEYELLVAVILSAQCTDKRVNQVTQNLFKDYNSPEKMIKLSVKELAEIIRPCGLNNSKARHVLSASEQIIKEYNGKVPSDFNKLKSLQGVGQKTANVVYAVAFGGDAIAVDTHVFRVSNRLGLTHSKNVTECEEQLKQIIDKDKWSKTHHYLIFLGRKICKARKPQCSICPVKDLCKKEGICS